MASCTDAPRGSILACLRRAGSGELHMRQGQSSWELQLLHHLPPRHPVVHVLLDGTGAGKLGSIVALDGSDQSNKTASVV